MRKRGGTQKSKKYIIIVIIILLLVAAGGGAWWWFNHQADRENLSSTGGGVNTTPIYSSLTGLEISDASLNSRPTYCMQIPNGSTDGARPQVGLDQAAVVFEAIAETGITRFAAVFQDFGDIAMVGPIRSLRPYYLEWDTPFDCTIVHDGGSHEALAEVGNGKYRNLDENFNYMWKEDYIGGRYRYWNNVFTSPSKLQEFNLSKNYTTSSPKTFPRLTPTEVEELLNTPQTDCATAEPADCIEDAKPLVTQVRTAFTGDADYIVNYQYDSDSNTYLRFYEGDGAHQTYHCASTDVTSCTTRQVAPSAVAVMRVQEHTMADNYHESIQTTGSGEAYIFQNGEMIEARWQKSSQGEQIKFTNKNSGEEIKFTPGQLWIAAVPQFGSVSWE